MALPGRGRARLVSETRGIPADRRLVDSAAPPVDRGGPGGSCERKPVAAVKHDDGTSEKLIVVCDDGSVWQRRLVGGGRWTEEVALPGTRRAREQDTG